VFYIENADDDLMLINETGDVTYILSRFVT